MSSPGGAGPADSRNRPSAPAPRPWAAVRVHRLFRDAAPCAPMRAGARRCILPPTRRPRNAAASRPLAGGGGGGTRTPCPAVAAAQRRAPVCHPRQYASGAKIGQIMSAVKSFGSLQCIYTAPSPPGLGSALEQSRRAGPAGSWNRPSAPTPDFQVLHCAHVHIAAAIREDMVQICMAQE